MPQARPEDLTMPAGMSLNEINASSCWKICSYGEPPSNLLSLVYVGLPWKVTEAGM